MTLGSFTNQHKNNPKNLNSSVDKTNISIISFKMRRFNKFWLKSTNQINLSLWRNAVNSTSGNEASSKLMKHWMWRNVCLSRGRNCTPWNTSRISQLCSLIDDRYCKTQQTNGMISTIKVGLYICYNLITGMKIIIVCELPHSISRISIGLPRGLPCCTS